jgi:hypothetical protein
LEKLAKRKAKKTRLSFKQGTAEYAISDQVIRCWFAKEGDYWQGHSVGTREYLRHIEAKTHGLIKKSALAGEGRLSRGQHAAPDSNRERVDRWKRRVHTHPRKHTAHAS